MVSDDDRAQRASGEFLIGGGEMSEMIRSKDWSETSLGPISEWPQSLLTTVSLCLASNFPINIVWGPDAIQIYNDGYRVVCGAAHPAALGEPYTVTWASAWPAIGEPFDQARLGRTSFLENQRMFLTRNGYLEETFFTFSLSPVRGESGGIDGLFHPVTETTASMLSERRTRALRDLTSGLANAATIDDVFDRTISTLSDFAFDLPFIIIYRLQESVKRYALTRSVGIGGGCAALQATLDAEAELPWPMKHALSNKGILDVSNIAKLFEGAMAGPYDEPPARAFMMPMTMPGLDQALIVVMVGVSPRLPLTDDYRAFYELIAAAIQSAITNVRAREEERQRAEALAEIDRAKTAFFSNVSHEFRTPLTLMLGPLQDMIEHGGGLPADQQERLGTAHRNSLRLLKLVNALLDFSRIEAGRMQASFEVTDLSLLTTNLASNFRSACERAGLDLIVNCEPLAEPIYVDRDMWEKIVLNLMSNAFKFTLEGTITVGLRATAGGAELRVSDTGVGIPDSEIDKVFDRFHRIEGQAGRTYEGTGIGLSLVKELVELHGASIAVESEVGRGSVFSVSVMAGHGHLRAEWTKALVRDTTTESRAHGFVDEALGWLPESNPMPVKARDGDGDGSGRRIILADDNADMRDYVRRILEESGYLVEPLGTGIAAIIAASQRPYPDLVLSDVMMPDLDGFALVNALRADPETAGIPIVLLSARAGQEARVEGLASGADDYIVKPFSARELRARIDGVIRLASQRREGAKRERDLQAQLAEDRGMRLRDTQAELEFALKAGRLGSWDIDLATDRLTTSEICRTNFGLSMSGSYSRIDLIKRVHPDDLDRRQAEIADAIANHAPLDLEYRVVDDDGSSRWLLMRGRADYDASGRPTRLAGVSIDITDRKRGEERQKLLLDELNHRVKNTLATVQSIALQTRRTASSPEDFSRALDARIAALAGAHDLLTNASWDGVSLGDVIALTVQPYESDGNRFKVKQNGPDILLGPNAAVTLNMAFHELATNAAKYGSLQSDGGTVNVVWAVDREPSTPEIRIEWQESGGPSVGSPSRRGFGSRLLEQGVSRELGGRVSIAFESTGLHCIMRLPTSEKMKIMS